MMHMKLPWHGFEHRYLPYKNESYNDPDMTMFWKGIGYDTTKLTGGMYDMRNPEPEWFNFKYFQTVLPDWKHLSWSFYKMTTGIVLPEHVDTFKRFKELYPEHRKHSIRRGIVFLEDWEPGHVLTIEDRQIEQWRRGDWDWFEEKDKHLAANVGLENRYTLQLTGMI